MPALTGQQAELEEAWTFDWSAFLVFINDSGTHNFAQFQQEKSRVFTLSFDVRANN